MAARFTNRRSATRPVENRLVIGDGALVLETARLLLRPPVETDLDGYAALLADEPAARFIGGVKPREGAWRSMALHAGSWRLRGYGMFSVIERSSRRWLGRVGPWQPEGWPGPEIGWALLREAWGKGLASEAATAAIDWVFDVLDWPEIVHPIAPGNAASAALAGRLGSINRGPVRMPPPFEDDAVDLWGQTAAMWRARRQ